MEDKLAGEYEEDSEGREGGDQWEMRTYGTRSQRLQTANTDTPYN